MSSEIDLVSELRIRIEKTLNDLIQDIGTLKIGRNGQYPFGWRKAAKGRTVWRLVEELISQNLEKNHDKYNLSKMSPSDSEVSVYDFSCVINGFNEEMFVNIKGSNNTSRDNKDDISKANELVKFYEENKQRKLFVATFVMEFLSNMEVKIERCIVMPISWLPDIYVNPSNNGNLQSSKYKYIETAIKRTNSEFLSEFHKAHKIALEKKKKKI